MKSIPNSTLLFLLLFFIGGSHPQGLVTPNELLPITEIQGHRVKTADPPSPLYTRNDLGIVTLKWVQGQIIHRARDANRGLYEIRGVITPKDEGHTWTEPQFIFATALKEFFANPWRDYNTSYLDVLVDNGKIHLFCPHRWERVLYLSFDEKDLEKFYTRQDLKNLF
jgi:hypothetical protein